MPRRSATAPQRPFILDEVIDSLSAVLRGYDDRAMDVINLKISKVGGLTKARQIRDLCVSLGIAMTIEDTWGGDIVTAAIAHLAHSTPPEFLFSATDFNSYVTRSHRRGRAAAPDGPRQASDQPGLGTSPRFEVLGKPVLEVGKLMFDRLHQPGLNHHDCGPAWSAVPRQHSHLVDQARPPGARAGGQCSSRTASSSAGSCCSIAWSASPDISPPARHRASASRSCWRRVPKR